MLKNSLNTLTDNQLIKLVNDNGDEDAFTEICSRYENVFYKVCQKYLSALSASGVNVQDIFDEKMFIILHCIKTFDVTKNTKLSTWIGNYARYLCLNSINARRFIIPNSDSEVIHKKENDVSIQNYLNKPNPDNHKYVSNIISQLKDKRVGEVFLHRYLSDKKMIWSNVAKKMNISTQTAINLHNKGILILRKKLKSKSISDII